MGRVFIKNGRVMPGFPGFNPGERRGRSGKSPAFRPWDESEALPVLTCLPITI